MKSKLLLTKLFCITAIVMPNSFAGTTSVTLANTTFDDYNVLTMELGGTAQGSGYDHLNITGTANLGGVMEVVFINDYSPSAGDSFDLLDGSTTGSFSEVSLPTLPEGLGWDTSQFDSDGILSIVSSLTPIQAWRQTHFGIINNSGDAADDFDFDKDGVDNLLEYAFGLNPTLASSRQLPTFQHSGGNLSYTFNRPDGISGISYFGEWSTTLENGSWNNITNTGTPPQFIFSTPIEGKDRLFIRLRVTNP